MKQQLSEIISAAFDQLKSEGIIPDDFEPKFGVDRTKDKAHGDFATNAALVAAKAAKTNPRALAEKLVALFNEAEGVEKTEIAGPGFINFFLKSGEQFSVINDVLAKGNEYGRCNLGNGKKIQVEFVSANPTGPLHVGHGRGAAYGATVADLLQAAGYDVHREYYVNDAGRQMDILATSVWLRYLELLGESFTFPSNGYKGQYVYDIAQQLKDEYADKFSASANDVFNGVPKDEPEGGDKEEHIDALINKAKALLDAHQYRVVFDHGLNAVLDDIKQDLGEFGVNYQEWYSERSLTDTNAVESALEALDKAGYLYEKEGATWFKSTEFGDEKDRVVKRDNGQTTYFASDIAYHKEKFERGFDQVINVWGADHHGYIPRVKAALQAMGMNPEKLDVLLVQFAVLYQNGEMLQMSTRSGKFVTLRELRNDVGCDAARFFYVVRKSEQHLDFDLDLAKSQSNDNPVYYIQYAHARIHSVFRQLEEKGFTYDQQGALSFLNKLDNEHEQALATQLAKYPEILERAAKQREPHQIAHYLRELANALHSFYNAQKVLIDDEDLRNARLVLLDATRQVLYNGLTLLGVSAPEAM